MGSAEKAVEFVWCVLLKRGRNLRVLNVSSAFIRVQQQTRGATHSKPPRAKISIGWSASVFRRKYTRGKIMKRLVSTSNP